MQRFMSRFLHLVIIFSCIICTESACFAGDNLPYGLNWNMSLKESIKKMNTHNYFKQNHCYDKSGKQIIDKMNKIYNEYGLLNITLRNKNNPSMNIYLEFYKNTLWNVVLRYNYIGEKSKEYVKNSRNLIYHDIVKQFNEPLENYTQNIDNQDMHVIGWHIGNTDVYFTYNDVQDDPVMNYTRVSYCNALLAYEVLIQKEKMQSKYGVY